MPIAQFIVTWDDIVNNANESTNGFTTMPITGAMTSYNNPAIVSRQVNLYGGKYRVTVDGFHIDCGAINTTSYMMNSQIININSSKFHLSGSGSPGLNFTNNTYNAMPDLKGCREFEINSPSGQLDLSITISQFGQNVNANVGAVVSPYTIDKTATWTSANFAYFILTLNFEELNDQATFGTVNKRTFLQ